MSSDTILVTGAAGYIGSVLTELLLDAGYKVRMVDRFFFGRDGLPHDVQDGDVIELDTRLLDESHFEGVAAVVDLAALSSDPAGALDPKTTLDVNCRARVRAATIAKASGVRRYVLPSSCSVYGFQDGVMDETSPQRPVTTYARSNCDAEQGVMELFDSSFCVVIARQATVYGLSRRMRFDLAINSMVRGFVKDDVIPIRRDGTQWRPFVHVRDTARALMTMLDAPSHLVAGSVFNVGSDEQNFQIVHLAEAIARALDVPFRARWFGDADHRSYRVSFKKVREKLGFTPSVTVETGAIEIYDALRNGHVDPDDPRTITGEWYRKLFERSRGAP